MHKFSLLLLVSICTLSLVATPKTVVAVSETQAPPAYPQNCPKGASTGDPSGEKTFTSSDPSQLQKYLQQVVYCANACYDEKVTVRVSLGADISGTAMTVLTVANNLCDVKDPTAEDIAKTNRGCAKGQKQPAITILVPAISHTDIGAQTIGPKSRCDPALKGVADSMLNAASKSDVSGLKDGLTALQNLPAQAPPIQNAGTDALNKALTGFGLSQDQADVITTNAASNGDLIKAFQSGDSNAINDAVKKAADVAGVTLNPELLDKISKLTPEELAEAADQLSKTLNDLGSSVTGFDQGKVSGALGSLQSGELASALSTLCGQLGSCGTACDVANPSMTCRTRNPGALTCGSNYNVCTSLAGRYGGFTCGQNNNTACFPTVEQGVAAQVALLRGSRYFGGGGASIYSAICGGYAEANCSEYASFVSRQTGIPVSQRVDPNDAKQIGAIVMAMARFENGRGVPFTPEQLEAGVKAAFGTGDLPGGTPGFVSGSVPGASNRYMGGASPFGSQNSAYTLGQPYTIGLPTGSGQAQQQSQGGGRSSSQIQIIPPVYDTPQSNVPQPAATIIAQPDSITPGTPVQVSWSSVGMKADHPCQVFINTVFLFGEGNEGTKFATTTNATAGQQWTFTLKCTALSGASIRQAAAVQIR